MPSHRARSRTARSRRRSGACCGRPTLATVPAFALRLAFGEMADAALLASTRVRPERLLAAGYRFRFPDLEGALRHLLGKDVHSAGRRDAAEPEGGRKRNSS